MTSHEPDTDELIAQAQSGDRRAGQQLLLRHRKQLRRMIGLHFDRRLAARIDPSDVVQEVLVDALGKLPTYLEQRPVPFYAWLRQLAWDRLVKLHRLHLRTQKRSTSREEESIPLLPDESALALAGRLLAPGSSPSRHLYATECKRPWPNWANATVNSW
jgi:RNA polymerase sigma-70 factor (ECF subfamily)